MAKKTHTEKWLAGFEKGPRVAPSRPAKKKRSKERTITENLEEALLVFKLEQDAFEAVGDGAFEAKEQFMKEWLDGLSEEDTPSVAQIEAAEDAVDVAIQQAYGDSFTFKQGEALVDAAQYLADQTDAEMQFSYDRDKGQVIVTLDQSFLKVWQEAIDGQGLYAWDDPALTDIKSVSKVINILDERAEVYGSRRLEQLYHNEWDRWEPGGSLRYHHLVKIAEEAAAEAR